MSFQRRELTKEQKFALKARLAKARKEAGTFTPRGASVDGNGSSGSNQSKPYKKNQKISGSQEAYQQRQQLEEAKRLEREQKEAEIQERLAARQASISRRKEQFKKLKSKNRRGQINLNNQIEHLLSKISK